MSSMLREWAFRARLACLLLLLPHAVLLHSQTHGRANAQPNAASALMVSDIHFEPFWDPAKAEQLNEAPAAAWEAILAAAPSADRKQRFDVLQAKCHARGEDTSFELFRSSLQAMRGHAAGAAFAVVGGDMVAHDFSCKYAALFPRASAADYRSFVVKTIDYVLRQLRAALPGVPIFAALGNNDSDCGDYHLDSNSNFLRAAAPAFIADLPPPDRDEALRTFAAGGYFSTALPAPFEHGRLLVLDDLFLSRKYTTCGGTTDAAAGASQIAWLRGRLELARQRKENVWVLAHIPPGVDAFTTVRKMRDVCGGKPPEMFLAGGELGDAIAQFGDVVRLALFAHTHMDELRLLTPSQAGAAGSPQPPVAVKLIPSISPINGNSPSFTVARADPATATMIDYAVFASPGSDAAGAGWTRAYDFNAAFHEPDFSAASVAKLTAGFAADPGAQAAASQAYIRNYYVRDISAQISAFWPQYSCAFSNRTAETYRACVCSPHPAAMPKSPEP